MKKGLWLAIAILALAAIAAGAIGYPFQPVYVFSGKVNPGTNGKPVDGDMAIVTKNLDEYGLGIYGYDYIGSSGASKLAGHYSTNAYCFSYAMKLSAGEKVLVGTVRDSDGFGAGPVEADVTGKGFELVADMTKVLGGGFSEPLPPSPVMPPRFKEIWFGNRLYHAALAAEGEKFIVNPTPKIKAVIEAVGDFGIKTDSVSIILDQDTQNAKTFSLAKAGALQAKTVGEMVSSLNVEYTLGNQDKLSDGDHTFTFQAAEATGFYATAEVCAVTVMGGPASILGPVVTYPSPFSPTKDRTCYIQYTLSTDADLEIFLYSVAGEIVKKLYGRKGQEGGSAGVNKVPWNGAGTYGTVMGNGIYSGTVYDPAQGKSLAKFKLTIFH